MKGWVIEKDMANLLNGKLGRKVFMGIAPESEKEPFCTLQTTTLGSIRTLDFAKPIFQLDVFAETPERTIEEAERIAAMLDGTDEESGSTLFDSIKARRDSLLQVEDGTWKAPIELTANCIRRK